MTRPGRRPLTALLTLAGLGLSACAATGPAAELEAPARIQPAPGERHLALGTRLLSANEPALAMRAFNASIALEGVSAEALTGAGIAAQRQGMLGTAREYLERARDLAPNSAIAQSNLGMVLLALGDHHGARTALRAAVGLSEDGGGAVLRRQLERAELAVAAMNASTRGDPAATQRVVRLGSDWFRLTEKPESDDGADAASALRPAPDAAAPGDADKPHEAGIGRRPAAGNQVAMTGSAVPAAPGTGMGTAGEIAVVVEAGTGRHAARGSAASSEVAPNPQAAAGPEAPAEQEMAALAKNEAADGAE